MGCHDGRGGLHPAAGPGLSGALGPCVKVGKKNRGAAKVC